MVTRTWKVDRPGWEKTWYTITKTDHFISVTDGEKYFDLQGDETKDWIAAYRGSQDLQEFLDKSMERHGKPI